MTAAQISRGGKFPPRFLYRILRKLVDAGLLQGVSGPGGGYALARQASRVRLLDVMTAVEGRSNQEQLTAVLREHRKAIARINQTSKRVTRRSEQTWSQLTLAQLAKLR